MRRVLRLALPALFLCVVSPVAAQDLPGCSPNNANERMCRAGNICVCRSTGGSLSGFPQAFRWDCGIQNGGCIPGTFERTQTYSGPSGVPGQRASTTTATTTTSVRAGLGKAEIAQAQAALARLGYQTGPADGVVGPRTRTALSAYLAKEGLPPSDRITPEIYRRLVP